MTNPMTLNGVSAANTIIDANHVDRVLSIGSGVTVMLSNVTLRNGNSAGDGGGIRNLGGILTLNHSTISNNHATDLGGGIDNLVGTLTLNSSTISNNSASSGGGIENRDATLTLNNSTLSNNSAHYGCGGIYHDSQSTLNAYYSTIVGNLANSAANTLGAGGGIYNDGGTVNLKGTVLAQNYAAATPSDCSGTLTSQDYNLIQTTAGCTISGATAHNITGVADVSIDSLKNNGGSTPTRALFAGSPAINAIPTAQCIDQFAAPVTVDQRGFPRPSGGACDIGAYEGSLPLPIYNRNLIRNGDAEDMAGSPTGAFVAMPNWSRNVSGTLVPYGAPGGFPLATDPGPVDRGFGFFAGGVSAYSYITQEINISSIGAAIDAGQVHYDLSGYFGGYATDDDFAALYADFLNASHGFIFSDFIGPVYAADRGNQTGLLFRGTTGLVPVGTRFIVIELDMNRSAGSYNDGYADNLSLVLSPPKVFLPLVRK
jgi:hypothetical protein